MEDGGPGLGELEGEVDAPVLLEEVPGAAAVELAGEHAGGEVLPAAARRPVAHRQQPGVLLVRQAVAGCHIAGLDVSAAGFLCEAAAHVSLALPHTILGLLLGVWSVDDEVALEAPLPGLVVVQGHLAVPLPQPGVLLPHLHQLLLHGVHLLGVLLHGGLHLAVDGVVDVVGHLDSRVDHPGLHLLQLGGLGHDDLLEELDGDALVPDLLLQALGDAGEEDDLLVEGGVPLHQGGLHLLLLHLGEVDVQVTEVLLDLVDDLGGVGDLLEVLVEAPLLPLLRDALQLLEQGDLLLLVGDGGLEDAGDGVKGRHGAGVNLGACLRYFTCTVQALF